MLSVSSCTGTGVSGWIINTLLPDASIIFNPRHDSWARMSRSIPIRAQVIKSATQIYWTILLIADKSVLANMAGEMLREISADLIASTDMFIIPPQFFLTQYIYPWLSMWLSRLWKWKISAVRRLSLIRYISYLVGVETATWERHRTNIWYPSMWKARNVVSIFNLESITCILQIKTQTIGIKWQKNLFLDFVSKRNKQQIY